MVRANFAPLLSRNYVTNHYHILNDWLYRWDEENCIIWFRLVLRGLLPMWVKCTLLQFFLFVSLLGLLTTIRKGFWCIMAQKTSFGARMCLLSIRCVKIECKKVNIPKIWLSRESQAKNENVRIYPITLLFSEIHQWSWWNTELNSNWNKKSVN